MEPVFALPDYVLEMTLKIQLQSGCFSLPLRWQQMRSGMLCLSSDSLPAEERGRREGECSERGKEGREIWVGGLTFPHHIDFWLPLKFHSLRPGSSLFIYLYFSLSSCDACTTIGTLWPLCSAPGDVCFPPPSNTSATPMPTPPPLPTLPVSHPRPAD